MSHCFTFSSAPITCLFRSPSSTFLPLTSSSCPFPLFSPLCHFFLLCLTPLLSFHDPVVLPAPFRLFFSSLCHLLTPSFDHPVICPYTCPSIPLLLRRVWEVTTGEVLNTLIHHNEAVLHLRFANGLMVTCSKDRSIAVWDMASPTDISLRRVLVGHRAAVNVVDFDDKYIVSASGDRTIKVAAIHEYKPETLIRSLPRKKLTNLQYEK